MDKSGRVLDRRWLQAEQPISPGSLLKPFVARAYAEQHGAVFPHVQCAGTSDRCWLPHGHGTLGLEDALAQSCNAYFLSLSNHLAVEDARNTLMQLGLAGPPRGATPAGLMGLTEEWRELPLTLAQAYLALFRDAPISRSRIASGMQRAAFSGTAAAVDSVLGAGAALAKTGTVRCTHGTRSAVDGFSVVLYPAEQPRILLLLRMHGATGAQTSVQAAAMLNALGFRV